MLRSVWWTSRDSRSGNGRRMVVVCTPVHGIVATPAIRRKKHGRLQVEIAATHRDFNLNCCGRGRSSSCGAIRRTAGRSPRGQVADTIALARQPAEFSYILFD